MRDCEICRPYVEHLRAEHRRLHGLLGSVRAALSEYDGTEGDRAFVSAARSLNSLRQELQHHFSDEETGGCLDEAVSFCPRLSAEMNRIEEEHPEILASIDRLLGQFRAGPATTARWRAIERQLHDLFQTIQEHEAAENRLLLEAFGVSVNGDDASRSSTSLISTH